MPCLGLFTKVHSSFEELDKLEKEGNRAKLEERNSQLPLGEKDGGGDVVEEA